MGDRKKGRAQKRAYRKLTKAQHQLLDEKRGLGRHHVNIIARGLPACADRDVMEGAALRGLLDAVVRYRKQRGKFGTFAAKWIRGAIGDELREMDWITRGHRKGGGPYVISGMAGVATARKPKSP